MSRVFVISDLHFGHKRITDFTCELGKSYRAGSSCTENMQNIITNWNSVVGKRDLVWVLGDIAFTQEGYDALGELSGRKKMVRGNHDDSFTTQEWLKHFETVEGITQYKGFWLTHAPIHPNELRGKRNVHGHVHHNSIVNSYTGDLDQRYVNVCCEAIGETPILFNDIRSGRYNDIRRC